MKTVVTWETYLGLETDIPVTDWVNEDKHFHKIRDLKATSLPGRRGKIELMILRVEVGPTDQRGEVLARLNSLASSRLVTVENRHHDFSVEFELKNGEGFMDGAIDVVRRIMEAFRLKDIDWRIAEFESRHDLLYKHRGEWIRDDTWHRLKHGMRPRGYEEETLFKIKKTA